MDSLNKWIADRLRVAWRDSCWPCRRPFVAELKFVDVRGDEVIVRFHRPCHVEWLAQQEALAAKALGLDRNGRE
jgi:hypothetical protein